VSALGGKKSTKGTICFTSPRINEPSPFSSKCDCSDIKSCEYQNDSKEEKVSREDMVTFLGLLEDWETLCQTCPDERLRDKTLATFWKHKLDLSSNYARDEFKNVYDDSSKKEAKKKNIANDFASGSISLVRNFFFFVLC